MEPWEDKFHTCLPARNILPSSVLFLKEDILLYNSARDTPFCTLLTHFWYLNYQCYCVAGRKLNYVAGATDIVLKLIEN